MTQRRSSAPGRARRPVPPRRPLDPIESVLMTCAYVGAGTVLAALVLAARCDTTGLYAAIGVLIGSGWVALVESERRSDSHALQAAHNAYRLRRRGQLS